MLVFSLESSEIALTVLAPSDERRCRFAASPALCVDCMTIMLCCVQKMQRWCDGRRVGGESALRESEI